MSEVIDWLLENISLICGLLLIVLIIVVVYLSYKLDLELDEDGCDNCCKCCRGGWFW